MLDLYNLLPHSKKDSKLDTKNDRNVINEVAELKGCSSVVFFETRKRHDLYVWMAKSPTGPTVKFHCSNVHTMAELKLTGNHLKGSRPLLSFSGEFDTLPHLQLLKEMFTQVFATPYRHYKSKPFVDHVLNFSVADGRVWIRNYQIVLPPDLKSPVEETSLTEVGPRLCLNPIRIFAGAFSGATLFENGDYVSPNEARREARAARGHGYSAKVQKKVKRKEHKQDNQLEPDEFEGLFKA